MEGVKIVLLAILSAVVYGIAHDQVTARVCVEYFTVGHPPVFQTDSPTLLGLGWGVIATWWVGLLLGIPLASIARGGTRPKLTARELVRPIAVLLAVMAGSALVAGVFGYLVTESLGGVLVEPMRSRIPRSRHALFFADAWAHGASYAVGFVGGIVVCFIAWRRRLRLAARAT